MKTLDLPAGFVLNPRYIVFERKDSSRPWVVFASCATLEDALEQLVRVNRPDEDRGIWYLGERMRFEWEKK